MIALGQGALLVSMIWAAALVWIIEHRFLQASGWMLVAAVLSSFGVIHAYQLTPQGIENRLGWWVTPEFTLSYITAAPFLLACHAYAKNRPAAFVNSDLQESCAVLRLAMKTRITLRLDSETLRKGRMIPAEEGNSIREFLT
jgi:hypothetical protein